MDNYQCPPTNFDLQGALLAQRANIVRWCAQWTGNLDIAENLAQETLIEAWRNADKLHNEAAYEAWLRGIARNVCRRWSQRRGREQNHLSLPRMDEHFVVPSLANSFADDFDLEVELERGELAALLDRALALLPPDTRTILIQKYVEDSPHAEIAARLGLSEGAVAMRLQRGKLAFQRILMTHMKEEAAAYGLVDKESEGWQETRIWCPHCGRQRLLGCFTRLPELSLRCPHCCTEPSINIMHGVGVELLGNITRFKPAFTKVQQWATVYYRDALLRQKVTCPQCRNTATVHIGSHIDVPPSLLTTRGIFVHCTICLLTMYISLQALTLCLPEVQQFWRNHTRIRTLPEREIDAAGRPAFLITVETIAEQHQLDIITTRDTFEVLSVHNRC